MVWKKLLNGKNFYMIKLVSDTINKDDINALITWLSQDEIPRLTKGELTIELEKKWAEKIGTKYSVFVNSGSSAILLTLAALKYSEFVNNKKLKNNKIIVPALSWATDVSSPMLLDYETIMCDCNLEDLSCDLNHLEKLFKEHDPSVLILVSPLGLVPKMNEVINLCEKYNVILLEDVCESMGSKYNDKYLGSMGYASFFSMYFGHHLSTIEGGFINTNDENFYHLLIMMRSHGWDRDLPTWKQRELRNKYKCSDFDSLYNFYVPGMNVRSTDLQAFIGLRVMDRLDDYSSKRRNNFIQYQKNININSNMIKLEEREDDYISSFAIPVVNNNKEELVRKLLEAGIEVRPLIAGNMANKPMWKGEKKDLNNCNIIDKYGFYLPNHQDLSNEDVNYIIKIING
jgi:CDP-6-deoxy-D-xylo-4-hexulose-3-dehydrase